MTTLDDPPVSQPSPGFARTRIRWFTACALLGAVVGAAAAFAVTPLLPTTYTAQSQVVVRSPSEITVFGNAVSVNVSTVSLSAAQVLRSQEVTIAASEELGGRLTPGEVDAQVTVLTTTNSPVVTVEAEAPTAELARELADAVPQAYLEVESDGYAARAEQAAGVLERLREDQEERLAEVQERLSEKVGQIAAWGNSILDPTARANFIQATLETDVTYQQLQNEAAALTASINSTDDAVAQRTVDYSILESGVDRIIEAQLPGAPSSPVLWQNMFVAALIGLLVGAGLAWRATERRRAVDAAAATAALDAPLLGRFGPERQLRRFPRFASLSDDESPGNELKVLTSSLLLSARRRNVGSIVITSARGREGKTVLASNIAAAGEYTGHSVALVDAATGFPAVTEAFGLSGAPGLSELLDGAPPANCRHLLPYGEGHNVPVVPVGVRGWREEPGRRLSEERRHAWATAFSGSGGLTAIVDGPAVNDHPLPLQLAGAGVLVVVVSPRTALSDLEVIRNRADVAGVTVLGFVLNEFRTGRPRRRRAATPAIRSDEQPAEQSMAATPAS